MKPVYSILDIMRILPHRAPFLLVDRVDEVRPSPDGSDAVLGRSIRATKCVTINEPFFAGHFPHRPVMPGVLQIECMAQVAALLAIDPQGPPMDVAILGVDNARFRKPVVPGDCLNVEVTVTKYRGSMFVVQCHIRVDGEVVSEAELMARMVPIGSKEGK